MSPASLRAVAIALAAVAATACSKPPVEPLSAENAWIREAPPGAAVMGGFLTLHNNSDHPVRCATVSSPDFGAIEIHRTAIEDGQSRMLREDALELPPGGTARLAPGGQHLMLFRPQRPIAAGDTARLDFDCGDERLTVVFTVRAGA